MPPSFRRRPESVSSTSQCNKGRNRIGFPGMTLETKCNFYFGFSSEVSQRTVVPAKAGTSQSGVRVPDVIGFDGPIQQHVIIRANSSTFVDS